ncbi:MAG: glycosyltransferase [Caldilineaceae bacterium]|nr:glycosyltransferase [Caldilineaceae bacterium]
MNLQETRVALVHDWLNQIGGAENVLEEFVSLFPQAPIYTSMYAADQMPVEYRSWPIHTSFMQGLPGVATHHQAYLPLYPTAFSHFDLSNYDIVISNKSGFCHGVQTASRHAQATHICYCLTPTRFLWMYNQYREREQLGRLSAVLKPVLKLLRRWDWQAAQRVDYFIAISTTVQERIKTLYGRESAVIHPPVDTSFFTPTPVPIDDYYLIVSRLIPYKRIDLAIEAFNHLPREKLLIVGEGRAGAALREQAGPNITFLGRQPRPRIRELLRSCKAFLFPGLEDFGIAPVEAMSAGRPVVAFGGGGALDTVVPGATGELFAAQEWESMHAVLEHFQPHAYDPLACRLQAEHFDVSLFRQRFLTYVEEVISGVPTTVLNPVITGPHAKHNTVLRPANGQLL